MGGGSTNAMTIIKSINDLEKLYLTKAQLVKCALQIGTDTVVCLKMIESEQKIKE